MLFPSASSGISYRLSGEALKTAYEIHELSKHANQEYAEIEKKIKAYSLELVEQLTPKYTQKFTDLIAKLTTQLGIPVDQAPQFHLDASYLDDHGVAFLKQSPESHSLTDQWG